jgi:hypothetical protein
MMGRRLLIVLGIVILIAAAGGVTGWIMWTHSPTYALKEIVAAVQQRDRYRFERYVDIDSVIQSFVSESTKDNPLAMAMANGVTPALKQQITKAIEDGTANGDSQMGDGVSVLMTGSADLHLERQGPNAYFGVPIKTKGGAPFTLRFHMTQVPDGYWRVDRVTNVADLLSTEATEETARKAALTRRIQEQLDQLSVAAKLHTSISDGWIRKNRFQVRFQNGSTQTIAGMKGRIICGLAGFDQKISASDLNVGPGQAANGVWEFRVNQFMADTEKMFTFGESDRFEVQVESIVYADGTTVTQPE